MELIFYRCIFSIETRWRLEEITGIDIQNFQLFWLLTMLISYRKPTVKSFLSYAFLGFYGLKWIWYMLIWIYQYHIWLFALASLAVTWWRHHAEVFSAWLAICAGNSPVPGEFPTQGPVTRSFNVFFDLRLNTRLSKQPWGWWFETPAWSLWRHRNGNTVVSYGKRTLGLVSFCLVGIKLYVYWIHELTCTNSSCPEMFVLIY